MTKWVVSAHPAIAALGHPLFACGGKRGLVWWKFFCHPEERRICYWTCRAQNRCFTSFSM